MTDDNETGLWMTVSELATIKLLTRSAISERVSRLEQQGLIKTKSGKGKTKLVNVAEFDRVIGQVADLAREQGAATRRGGDGEEFDATPSASSTYSKEQAKRMAYLAEMSRLDLAERMGKLIRADQYTAALNSAVSELVRIVDALPQKADEIGIELGVDDTHKVRFMLKRVARDLRNDLSKGFMTMAAEAPEFDEPITEGLVAP